MFVYFLFFCRELREKIQPEIMELIKQQRLNRLCEGTCFRKISSRRRQGEPHGTHTQTHTHTHIQPCIEYIHRSQPHRLCSQGQFFSFLSHFRLCVCSLSLLSAPPLIALFPLRYENLTGDMISQEISEALDCCRAAVVMVHTHFSGSVRFRGRHI